MSLGETIRSKREAIGLTQDQLAARADISKPYLSNIETGRMKNPPTDRVVKSLERSLGFEDGQLIRAAHWVRTPMDVRERHELLEAELQKLKSVLKGLLAKAPRDVSGAMDLAKLAEQVGPDGNVQMITASVPVPVINDVAAGYPHNFTDLDYPRGVADDYIRCPDMHDPQAFAARVVGDSMEPDYRQGDIVVFSPNTSPLSGDDCFVRFEDDASTTFKRFYQDDEREIRLQPLNNRYPAQIHPTESISGLWPAVFRIQRLR